MPRTFFEVAVTVIVLLAVCVSDGAQTSRRQGGSFFSQFRIITERNIFSRQRGRRRVETRTERSQPARRVVRRTEESYLVLAGLAKVNDVYVAFLEDTRGGSLLRVTAGGSIARGKITKLNLDSVIYELEGNRTSVMIGQTLEGELGLLPVAEDSFVSLSETVAIADNAPVRDDANTPSTERSDTPPGSEDEAEIIRRLMERRKQEELGE